MTETSEVPESKIEPAKEAKAKSATHRTRPASSGVRKASRLNVSTGTLEQGSPEVQAFVKANEAIIENLTALSSEMVAFGARRLNENIECAQSLIGCKDPEQLSRVQSSYIEHATEQYLEQIKTVMNLVNGMTKAFLTPLDVASREALDKAEPKKD